jgi:hypothetical protein
MENTWPPPWFWGEIVKIKFPAIKHHAMMVYRQCKVTLSTFQTLALDEGE